MFGFREWRRPCDAVPLAMDVDYIRTENYLGWSFRAKMQEWLAQGQPDGAAVGGPAASVQRVTPGGERLLVLRAGRIGNGAGQEEIVYCAGDLILGEGAVFRREIFCQGQLETEAGVQLQSVAADGNLVLGANNDVARWVDAEGRIIIRRGTVVRSRASSLQSMELERDVSAQSLYAPLISSTGCVAEGVAEAGEELLPVPAAAPNAPSAVPTYLEGLRCTRLEPKTWLVQGDLRLPSGSRVEENLIVKGTLTSSSRCLFFRDVKAARLKLGQRNRALGNLSAEGSLEIGEESFVERNVTAGNHVRLARGARVGRPEALAVISAAGEITLEQNVAVCGKVSAGQWIRTV